ncbi:MAG: TolC family protein [Cognatishimia sp.]|uniref:TolC family protein n=1 Tax=Cognatishimia sp. 1_MG-2023 TaxID=3062642 RepID=UPI0026E39253|nr:TolC family protein [Cognatishimia sp. 1_MG-2023]MDO6725934.1 TolC family protein [Cognatishimia sp. 1_MG-2023]
MARLHSISLMLAFSVLSGCMPDMPFSEGLPFLKERSEAKTEAKAEPAPLASSFAQNKGEANSELIEDLLGRRSILSGGVYQEVADATLASAATAAEAELRTAKLRAEAEDKNWLPTIGPSISLSSLGDAIASLVVDQVVFDNGRRKADRAYAAADVEVAAVTLAEDVNERVYTALALYVAGVRGDEKSTTARKALSKMHRLEQIVVGRVEGGVSNKGDQRTVEGKVHDLQSTLKTAGEAAGLARAELTAITKKTFVGAYEGPLDVSATTEDKPLAVMRAMAEAKRSIAQATSERAGQLPGINASANVGTGGSKAGLKLGGDNTFGFGTGARLKAIESTKETAERQVAEAEQDAGRALRRAELRIASLQRKEQDAARLAKESYDTYELFEAQFRAGQRSVLEVINIYEKAVEREMDQLDAKFDVLIAQLEMARDLGILADGDAI